MPLSDTHPVDLTTCDREPIHLPGHVQPHGLLLVLRGPGHAVSHASANVPEHLGRPLDDTLGASLDELFGPEQARHLRAGLDNPSLEGNPLYLRTLTLDVAGRRRSFHASAHRHDGALLLELELTPSAEEINFRDLYPLVRASIAQVQAAAGVEDLCRLAAEEVRRITGFDRTLVYRFDRDWNGCVVAESVGGDFPPYLGLWFPASDIPRQARELYKLTRLRLIVDAAYSPVPLVPPTHPDGRPLDLTFAALRGVSPIHLEYLRNMGVRASMSIVVLREGELWGLISCHHRTPRIVPFDVRTACDLLAQYLGQRLTAQEHAADFTHRMRLKAYQSALLGSMAGVGGFVAGLTADPARLLEFTGAGGAAILFEGTCTLVGRTPSEQQVRDLADRLAESGGEVFVSDALAEHFPEASAYGDVASGLLAVQISKLYRSYVAWFRPEVVRTVNWGGDPRKPAESGTDRLHPRKSFELWKETVRGRSQPWREAEVAAATDLRNDVIGLVLRRAEERAQLVAELQRSNQELESFSYSVSHDLRAPFRHVFGYAELLKDHEAGRLDETSTRYLDTIMASARDAGRLVDSLLAFSQMSRAALDMTDVDLGVLVEEVRRELQLDAGGRLITWQVGPLPVVRGDLGMLRQVVRNLLQNAVKYTTPRAEAVIAVGSEVGEREAITFVGDNGVGFDMKYVGKLFGVFQRLHSSEEFEGTGIGLANVRRIVARHGGRTWAEGRVGKGATFFFALPLPRSEG